MAVGSSMMMYALADSLGADLTKDSKGNIRCETKVEVDIGVVPFEVEVLVGARLQDCAFLFCNVRGTYHVAIIVDSVYNVRVQALDCDRSLKLKLADRDMVFYENDLIEVFKPYSLGEVEIDMLEKV